MTRNTRIAGPVRYVVASAFMATGLLLILGSQWAAHAGTAPTSISGPQLAADGNPLCDADDDDPLDCGGPVDKVAGMLASDGATAPDPRDADLGGVAATGVLLMSVGGAVVAGAAGAAGSGVAGAAGSGVAGAAGAAGSGAGALPGGRGLPMPQAAVGTTAAAGGVAAAANVTTGHDFATAGGGFSLPVPRAELVQGGLSIFRSMKRVTEDANPAGYSPGDVAQMLGDAAGIAVLASALAPAVGLISLAAGGAAAATDVKSPQEIFDQMRQNFGRLGYMQGVVDENVSHVDSQLGDLDVSIDAVAGSQPPADPTVLSARDLKAARTEWARRADAAFDTLAITQTEMGDLDVRRSNLAHQIDQIGDLLVRIDQMVRIDQTGSVLLPANLAATISYGRGWYFAGESSKMAAALRESFARSRAAGAQRRLRAGGTDAAVAAGAGAAGSNAVTLGKWAEANRIGDGRLAVLQALAGLERWRGFYDALAGSVQERIGSLRQAADQAVAARRDLAVEVQRRSLQGHGK